MEEESRPALLSIKKSMENGKLSKKKICNITRNQEIASSRREVEKCFILSFALDQSMRNNYLLNILQALKVKCIDLYFLKECLFCII